MDKEPLHKKILDAKMKLLYEYTDIKQVEMNVTNIKALARELDIDLPDGYNPLLGQKVGEIFGIPLYVSDTADDFVMISANKGWGL